MRPPAAIESRWTSACQSSAYAALPSFTTGGRRAIKLLVLDLS